MILVHFTLFTLLFVVKRSRLDVDSAADEKKKKLYTLVNVMTSKMNLCLGICAGMILIAKGAFITAKMHRSVNTFMYISMVAADIFCGLAMDSYVNSK